MASTIDRSDAGIATLATLFTTSDTISLDSTSTASVLNAAWVMVDAGYVTYEWETANKAVLTITKTGRVWVTKETMVRASIRRSATSGNVR